MRATRILVASGFTVALAGLLLVAALRRSSTSGGETGRITAPPNREQNGMVLSMSQEESVSLTVTAPRVSTKGTPILAHCSIKNLRDSPIRVYESGRAAVYHLSVSTDTGVAVPLTEFGKNQLAEVETMNVSVNLRSNEEATDVYDLTKLFEMSQEGEFKVSAHRYFTTLADLTVLTDLNIEGIRIAVVGKKD